MDATSDSRFDPNYAAQMLLEIAHEQSVELLLEKLVTRAVTRPNLACAQVWLIAPGDRCTVCPHRAICPDQRRCLHLVAGRGVSLRSDPKDIGARFDDLTARNPLGVGLLGRVAVTREQLRLVDPGQQPGEMPGFDWLEPEKVRAVSATPIMFKDEVLGAIVGFTRAPMPEEARPWGRIFADHVGAALANARAFEEIQRLKAQLELQNAYLQEEVVEARAFGELVGQSAALRQIMAQIDLVAPTEASVLILGETGTGKELVAREIHRRSQRKEGPLVRVNCASIPKDLFESEFFGHVRGAFTGALKDRAGRFETAEGGTLLLDEIGEVPLEMQGKLLRVLQEKRYERVGDDRTRQASVRIIAATNRDLKQAVAAGRFREDLYYRLHVFPIQVPPLHERKDDIPLLARHFVDLSVKELRCPTPRLTRAALTQLQGYHWPGNIRELRNVIERAVILARGGPLQFDLPVGELPAARLSSGDAKGATVSAKANLHPSRAPAQLEAARQEPRPAAIRTAGPASSNPTVAGAAPPAVLTETEVRERERENLLAALTHTGWKIKGADGAAALLGLKPTTLISRLHKLGLQRPSSA